jgi:tRNA (guanine10-N2)-methyltransferase
MEVYEMSQVITDLIAFAATYLVVGGRLVFWLPTLNDEYTPEDVPTHPQMSIIANSEQNFGKWSRKLITMEKTGVVDGLAKELLEIAIEKPGHANFREKYFTSK